MQSRRAPLSEPDALARHRWLILAVLCLSVVLTGLDNTILNVALPTLARPPALGGLGATSSELQWIVDAYTLVFAGLLLTAGSLGDRFGRYGALTFGLVVFGLGSVIAATATTADLLIGGRAVMGVGGAFVMLATLSILANVFVDPVGRGRAIAIWAASAAIGLGLGPLLGGILLEHFWWGAVLLVNIPIVVVALVVGWWILPTSRDPSAPRLDAGGALLSIGGFATLLWAIIEGPSTGWTAPAVLAAFAAAVALLTGFVAWELHSTHPMLDMRFFRNPRFTAASSAITISFMVLSGLVFLLSQYLQSVHDYSPLHAGLLTLGFALGMAVMSPLAARIAERIGTTRIVTGGMLLVAAALLLALLLDTTSPAWLPATIALVVALGFGAVMAPATEAIMGALPRAKAGVGSAVNDTTRQLGAAIGVALFGSILASRYHAAIHHDLTPHLSPSVLAAVNRSVQSALAIARSLPPIEGTRIMHTAGDAYMSGFHAAALVGAIICIIAAVAVARWLPARHHDSEPTNRAEDDSAPVSTSR